MGIAEDRERITAEIAEIRRSIKRKHFELTRGRIETELRLQQDIKPLTEPLIKLTKQIGSEEGEIKRKKKEIHPTPQEIYPKSRPLPRMTAEELKAKEEHEYNEFKKRFDISALTDQLIEEDRMKYGKRSYADDGSVSNRSFGEIREGGKRSFSKL